MKLVLLYEIGDKYTWGATDTLPFEYESKEAAEIDLFELWDNARKQNAAHQKYQENTLKPYNQDSKNWYTLEYQKLLMAAPITLNYINFAGMDLDLEYLTIRKDVRDKKSKLISFELEYVYPRILELDKWFEEFKNKR